jgi:hypothetical protein
MSEIMKGNTTMPTNVKKWVAIAHAYGDEPSAIAHSNTLKGAIEELRYITDSSREVVRRRANGATTVEIGNDLIIRKDEVWWGGWEQYAIEDGREDFWALLR